jgi:tRNA dimethylallyltransferase
LHESLKRIDPAAAGRIHPNDLRRIVRALEVHELTGQPISELQAQWDRDRKKYECVFVGIRREKEDLHRRINERVRKMIAEGLVDEVRRLLTLPHALSTAAKQALGYAEVLAHLAGEISLEDAAEMIKINTRQFAKSQRTWFKRFREIEWIDVAADDTAGRVADDLMARRGSLWLA